ncbi:MAG: tetratricopeptide repeat protein, partial [Phycisphaerales bacterium]|nr:tetratricopeptide repeat protein [Phycisphaerales bacterium]
QELGARLLALQRGLLCTRHDIAWMTWLNGETTEALAACEQTWRDRSTLLGPDDPDTLQSRHVLGVMLNNTGGHQQEAIQHLQATFAARRVALGATHPDTIATLRELAFAHRKAGELELALPYFQEALASEEARPSPDWRQVIDLHKHLAALYRDMKADIEIPLEHLRIASQLLDEHRPDDVMERLETRGSYAKTLHEFHDYEAAAPILEQVVEEARTLYPEADRWKIGYYLALLGSTRKQLDDVDGALAALREAAELTQGSRFESVVARALAELEAKIAEGDDEVSSGL